MAYPGRFDDAGDHLDGAVHVHEANFVDIRDHLAQGFTVAENAGFAGSPGIMDGAVLHLATDLLAG